MATVPEQLWFEIRKAATIMERRAEAVVYRATGVSLGVFMVLSVLHAYGEPVTQRAVTDRLGLTKGTVSRLLDVARASGLVTTERSSTSRREHAVSLTAGGLATVEAGDAALAVSELASYARAHPQEAQGVVTGLRGFVETLESQA